MKCIYILAALAILLLIIVVRVILLIGSVSRYSKYWDEQNSQNNQENPIIYVALGDSAAQGIGASSPDKGYVGLLASRLSAQQKRPVRVINLSVSGAKIADVSRVQIPQLKNLKPDVITLDIGGNDIKNFNKDKFEMEMKTLFDQLPKETVVAELPFFGGRSRLFAPQDNRNVIIANDIIGQLAAERKIIVAPLYNETKSRNQYPWTYAIDYFHPNNLGYRAWADAFWNVMK